MSKVAVNQRYAFNLVHGTRLTHGYKPLTSSFSPPAPGCWRVFLDLPNGLRVCLAQAPGSVYDEESTSGYTVLEKLRSDLEVKELRDLYRADLVQLIGSFDDGCGYA